MSDDEKQCQRCAASYTGIYHYCVVLDGSDAHHRCVEKRQALAADLRARYGEHPAANPRWYDDAVPRGKPMIGIDYAAEPSHSVVAHRCARCNATLIDYGDLDAQYAAHQESCFVVGDYVKWRNPVASTWVAGELLVISEDRSTVRIRIADGPGWKPGVETAFGTCNGATICRIPRPELTALSSFVQDIANRCADRVRKATEQVMANVTPAGRAEAVHELAQEGYITREQARELMRSTEFDDLRLPTVETTWMRVGGPPPDPLATLYDGVTLRALIDIERMVRMETVRGREPFTPAQRAAVSAHWSAALRARIDAAREAERTQVVIEPDAEDFPW